jgi:Tfp pilus assembly protein PilO
MGIAFIIFIVLAIIAIAWSINYAFSNNNNNIDLKEHYEQCLKGTDKRVALNAGRAYHKSLRSNKILTMYDEMAIANDLSTMKLNECNP